MDTPKTWEAAARQAAESLRLGDWSNPEDEQLVECMENHVTFMRENGTTVGSYEALADDALRGYVRHTGRTRSQALSYIVEVIAAKQHDYGHDNITVEGHVGLRVRIHDKVARLKNLLRRGGEAKNEAMSDTWMDIVGYCIIGIMLTHGTFTLPLEIDQNNRS